MEGELDDAVQTVMEEEPYDSEETDEEENMRTKVRIRHNLFRYLWQLKRVGDLEHFQRIMQRWYHLNKGDKVEVDPDAASMLLKRCRIWHHGGIGFSHDGSSGSGAAARSPAPSLTELTDRLTALDQARPPAMPSASSAAASRERELMSVPDTRMLTVEDEEDWDQAAAAAGLTAASRGAGVGGCASDLMS